MVQVGSARQSRQLALREKEIQRSSRKSRYSSSRLRLTTTPTKIHLQRPEKPFKDFDQDTYWWWLRGRVHYVKGGKFPNGRYIECNADQCLVCAATNPAAYGLDAKPNKALARADARTYYSVSGWVEHKFHAVEKKRDEPTPDGRTTYNVYERCGGKSCKLCRDGASKLFGNKFFYDFSGNAWIDAIEPIMEKLDRMAKDGGYIYPQNYVCEECGTELFDMTRQCFSCESENVGIDPERHVAVCQDCDEEWTLLEYEDEELFEKANKSDWKCSNKKCGHVGYPKPVFLHTEGKKKWESYDIFDIQMTIKKASKDQKAPTVVVAWEIKEPDPRLFDPKFQGKNSEVAEARVKFHRTPMDLASIHAPEIPAVQADILDMDNLFAGAGGRASKTEFKRYDKKKKRDEDEDEEDADEDEDEETSDDSDDEDDE